MKNFLILSLVLLFASCQQNEKPLSTILLSGSTADEAEYLVIANDTIPIKDGRFLDTLRIEEELYDYVKLDTWKWGKLMYLKKDEDLNIDFTTSTITVKGDALNDFLLNSDSILKPYSLSWNMNEEIFRSAIKDELRDNLAIIDSAFANLNIAADVVDELKTIEKFKVGHRTANFISFQERKGKSINRNIYDFMKDVDLNNERLVKQVNNRNFQYYYLIDKVNEEVPDSIYPFVVIDTVNKYSALEGIREMIISSVAKSSFYDESVNHQKLLSVYEDNFGALEEDDKLRVLYDKIQRLTPGNVAPSFGALNNVEGDSLQIEDLRGKHILLTVWGTWCPYCKEELPALKNLIDTYGEKFTNVAISFDKDKDKWKEYIAESDWDAIHLNDPVRSSTFKSNYLMSGTNVYLLINKEGVIVSSKSVKPSSEELMDLIKKLD